MTEDCDRTEAGRPASSTLKVGAYLRRQPWWYLVLGLVLGSLVLALAMRGIDAGQVWSGVQRADSLWVGVSLLTVLLTTAAKVCRWHGLFPPSESLRYPSLARALVIGQVVNALLPARLGEVARLYTLGRDESGSKATAAATIVAEKTFDILFLILAAGLTAALASLPGWLTGSLLTAAGLGALVFALAAAVPRRWIVAAGERITSSLPQRLLRPSSSPSSGTPAAPDGTPLHHPSATPSEGPSAPLPQGWSRGWGSACLTHLLDLGLDGLESLRSPRMAALACAWSLVIWGLSAGTNLTLLRAFHLPPSAGAALLLLTLLHVGTAPPSSPGRLGVFHALAVLALQLASAAGSGGVDRATAFAYATVLHAVVYGPQIVLGALALGLRLPGKEAM